MKDDLHARLACWVDAGQRVAAASVVRVTGSTPRPLGLAMLVNEAGEVAGALSGGCVDGVVVEACDRVLSSGAACSLEFGVEKNAHGDAGLVCGGSMGVWLYELPESIARGLTTSPGVLTLRGTPEGGPSEVTLKQEDWPGEESTRVGSLSSGEIELCERFGSRDLVLIVGQSGFTNALARLAGFLGYEVIVCEPRRRFASVSTPADKIVSEWPDQCVVRLGERLNARSAVIVCTHDRKFDEPALLAAVRSGVGFIGAMGSRRTAEERRLRLLDRGLSEAEIARIRSPLGLDIGGRTPAETALSVFAEWIAEKNGRTGLPLTQLKTPIHGNHGHSK